MVDPEFQAWLAEADRMQRSRPLLSRIHLVLPAAILVATIVLLKLAGRLASVSAVAATSFFTVGKLIILSGALPDFPLRPFELALMVFYMDLLYAYFLAYNLHHVYRLRRVGPWLQRLQNYCRYWIVQQPWMRRWAFTGVALFVLFPLTGTGAPGASILGRLVGLRAPTTLIAIATGSALGCGIMAAFAHPLEPVFHDIQHAWWFEAAGLLILAIVLLALIRLGRRLSRAAEEYARTQVPREDA